MTNNKPSKPIPTPNPNRAPRQKETYIPPARHIPITPIPQKKEK